MRTTSLVILVLALAVVGWFYISGDRAESTDLGGSPAQVEMLGAEGELPRRRPGSSLPNPKIGSDETLAASDEMSPAPLREIQVRCVNAETGAPVPDARVYVLDFDWSVVHPEVCALSLEERLGTIGRGHDLNEAGYTTIPVSTQSRWVGALAEDLAVGMENISRGDATEIVLALSSRRFVEVEVVGPGDEPRPGVPVAIRRISDRGFRSDEAVTKTDGHGRARLDVTHLRKEAGYRGQRVAIGCVGIFDSPVEYLFDPARPPVEPTRLELPASGPVIVRAEPRAPDLKSRVYFTGDDENQMQEVFFQGREARLDCVAVATKLQVRFVPAFDSSAAEQLLNVTSSTVPDEPTRVTLDLDAVPARPLVRFRCLGPGGE